MHQYLTETGPTLGIDDTSREIFVVNIPELSFSSDALLYAMHTVAALHLEKLGRGDTAGFSLEGVASKYFSMALREHKREITQMGRETVDPIFMTACFIRICAAIQLQGRSRRPYTPPWEWLSLIRTSATFLQEVWTLVGVDRNSPAYQLVKRTRHIHNRDYRIARSANRRRLEHLMRRDINAGDGDVAVAEPWDEEIQTAYEATIEYIGHVLDVDEQGADPSDVCSMLVIFPMLAEKRFIELVRDAVPRALVILAHFFALYAKYGKCWFMGNAGPNEVRALAEDLTGEWRELMDWPLKRIEANNS